jgi:CheY-like chemotaxis protein
MTRHPSGEPAGAHLLIVNDRAGQVDMYRYALEGADFIVASARTGRDALARGRKLGPDVMCSTSGIHPQRARHISGCRRPIE